MVDEIQATSPKGGQDEIPIKIKSENRISFWQECILLLKMLQYKEQYAY